MTAPTAAPSAMPEITDDYMQAMLAASRTYTAMLLRVTPKAGEPDAPAIVWEHGRRNFVLRLKASCRSSARPSTKATGPGSRSSMPHPRRSTA